MSAKKDPQMKPKPNMAPAGSQTAARYCTEGDMSRFSEFMISAASKDEIIMFDGQVPKDVATSWYSPKDMPIFALNDGVDEIMDYMKKPEWGPFDSETKFHEALRKHNDVIRRKAIVGRAVNHIYGPKLSDMQTMSQEVPQKKKFWQR